MAPAHPPSIPPGVVVELSRSRVLPGMGDEVDRWMAMLHDRIDECVASLDRERMALEIVFRRTDADGEWLYWVTIRGEAGAGIEDSPHGIDRDHIAFARRCKEPGWEEADPALLLAPAPVRDALLAWALGGAEPPR